MNTAPIPRMDKIESLAGAFATARGELAEQIETLRDMQEAAKRQRLRFIRAALTKFTAAHDVLKNAVQDSADLFQAPKTRMLHGVKVGFMKQRGKLEIDNTDQVVKLIRKHFPEQFDALVKTTYTPVRPALQNMQVGDMKRLGVRVTDDVDAVVIKPADSELDKLIDALLNDEELEEVR
jgi:hypothetical protein